MLAETKQKITRLEEQCLTDIVERLHWTAVHGSQEQAIEVMRQAADEIEKLREQIKELSDEIERLTPDLWGREDD